jgi:hypothetical protein
MIATARATPGAKDHATILISASRWQSGTREPLGQNFQPKKISASA